MLFPKLLPASLLVGIALAAPIGPLRADVPPTASAPTDPPPPPPDAPPPRRDGDDNGPSPRRDGDGDGPRRPRSEGRGPMREMTPEERRQRALGPYLDVLPDLTTDQQTQILAVVDDVQAQIQALRNDDTLSPQQRGDETRRLRGTIDDKIVPILTPAQRTTWQEAVEEQRQLLASTVGQLGQRRPDETREEKRTRLSLGYEDILDELSIKQRSQILAALGTEDDTVHAILLDASLSDKQQADALTKAHSDALTAVDALLDSKQRKEWNKAQKVHEDKVKALSPTPSPDSDAGGRGPRREDR